MIPENSKPIIAKLTRCIDGPTGKTLLRQQAEIRAQLQQHRADSIGADSIGADARQVAALAAARRTDNLP